MAGSADLFALSAGAAPSVAMAWTYLAMAQSIGLLMNNAVTAEKNMQTTANAATTVACARMLATLKTS